MKKINGITKMEETMKIKKMGQILTILSVSLISVINISMAGSKGKSGGQFLRVGVGARGPAMAGAFSPIVDDATAIYWNPAGLALLEKRNVELTYNSYFKDTASQFAGYAHPTRRGVFGLGVSLFGVKDIEKRSLTGGDSDTPDLGNFDTRDMAVSLGWANKMGLGDGILNYGAALKYISSDLETEKANTAAVDLGVIHQCHKDKGLSLSLAVLNLGGELKFKDTGDPLPLNIKPGVAWRQGLGKLGKLSLALDGDILVNDGIGYVQPGFEWWAHRAFALRGGYQFGRDKDAGQGFGVGAGFRLFNIGVDYAFVPFGDLGDTHRMSLGVKF